MAAQDTPDAAERRARAALDAAEWGCATHGSCGWCRTCTAARDLARDVLSLAVALRAAEARVVAAEAEATRASIVCCPECDGGTVIAHVGFGHESSAMEPQSCDECGGSGRVTWARMASLCIARGERIARIGTTEVVDEGTVF